MNERNILIKVLRLDKDIHREIFQSSGLLRLLLPLYFIYQFISYYSSQILSLNYLNNFKIFISTNPEFIGFSSDEISILLRDIDDLINIINTPFQLGDLFSGTLIAIIFVSIYLGIIYIGIKIKKIEANFIDLVVLYLTSVVPKIFYITVLFTNGPGNQTLLVLIFFIYSLVIRISALKQIYYLNNANAIVLTIWPFILFFTFGFISSIFI